MSRHAGQHICGTASSPPYAADNVAAAVCRPEAPRRVHGRDATALSDIGRASAAVHLCECTCASALVRPSRRATRSRRVLGPAASQPLVASCARAGRILFLKCSWSPSRRRHRCPGRRRRRRHRRRCGDRLCEAADWQRRRHFPRNNVERRVAGDAEIVQPLGGARQQLTSEAERGRPGRKQRLHIGDRRGGGHRHRHCALRLFVLREEEAEVERAAWLRVGSGGRRGDSRRRGRQYPRRCRPNERRVA